MFRDKEEELERLQQELLEQEEPEEQPADTADAEEDLLDEQVLDDLLKDTRAAGDRVAYQNFSNGYGRSMPEPVKSYKAYNTDKLDVDPQELSDRLEQTQSNKGLLIAVGVLAVAVLGVACYLLLKYRGYL